MVEPAGDDEVERVFSLVHDETNAKEQAQQAIQQSGLILESSEIISARWMFDDDDDLCNSLFAYYEMPFDQTIAQQIYAFLGSRLAPTVANDGIDWRTQLGEKRLV